MMNRQNQHPISRQDARRQETSPQDEIARLRAQITREYEMLTWAKSHLTSESAKQLYITRRQSTIHGCCTKLGRLIGGRQAASLVQQILAQTPSTRRQSLSTRPLE